MTPATNKVIVRPSPDFEAYKFGMQVVGEGEAHRRHCLIGEVVAVGERRWDADANYVQHWGSESLLDAGHTYDLRAVSLTADVPFEVKVGDKVMYRYVHRLEHGTLKEAPMGGNILMPYESLYARLAGDTLIPLNGYVFLGVTEGDKEVAGVKVGRVERRLGTGIVVAEGCLVSEYLDYPGERDEVKCGIGSVVLYRPNAAVKLELEEFSQFAWGGLPLYAIHRRWFVGINRKP